MKAGVIPFSWFGITGAMSAEPNLALLEEVKKRWISVTDLAAVQAVWAELILAAKAEAAQLQTRTAERVSAMEQDRIRRDQLANAFPEVRRILKKGKHEQC